MAVLGLAGCAAQSGEREATNPLAVAPAQTAAAAASPAQPAAAPAPAASTLTGTRWTGVVEGSPDPRTLPRLEFGPQGRLVGYTGCNMLSGLWRMEGDELRFGPLVTTKRYCLGPENETERRVLAALAEGTKVTREAGKLVFVAPGGARFEFIEAAAT